MTTSKPIWMKTVGSKSTKTTAKTKIATSNLFITPSTSIINNAQQIEDLLFGDLGGHEISIISRYDTVSTDTSIYQPIKNMSVINQTYDPIKILALQAPDAVELNLTPISLGSFLPLSGSGPNGETVYSNNADGSITIDVIDLPDQFFVEVEFISFEELFSDTIYE